MIHGGTGPLLLSAVAGYWVLERAARQKGRLQQIGRILGTAIIVISLVGVACRIWCIASCSKTPGMTMGGFCPFTSKATSVPSK